MCLYGYEQIFVPSVYTCSCVCIRGGGGIGKVWLTMDVRLFGQNSANFNRLKCEQQNKTRTKNTQQHSTNDMWKKIDKWYPNMHTNLNDHNLKRTERNKKLFTFFHCLHIWRSHIWFYAFLPLSVLRSPFMVLASILWTFAKWINLRQSLRCSSHI